MKGERRYSKEVGIKVCDCECQLGKKCPVTVNNPCTVAKAKAAKKVLSITLID